MKKENSTNSINEAYLNELCDLQQSLSLIGGRWTLAVLFSIARGNDRFSTLQKNLANISKKVLSERVSFLDQRGIIRKVVISEKPLNIEYQITEKGQELMEALVPIKKWAKKNT